MDPRFPAQLHLLRLQGLHRACNLAWLIDAYRTAIVAAEKTSHMLTLILERELVRLYKTHLDDYAAVEQLIEEITEITSVQHDNHTGAMQERSDD